MNKIHRLFKTLRKDGLISVNIKYQDNNYVLSSQAKKPLYSFITLPKYRLILFLILFGVVILLMINFWPGLATKTGTEGNVTQPAIKLEEILDRIVLRNDYQQLNAYLKDHRYVDLTDEYGWTPLHWAAFSRNDRMVRLLSKHGASSRQKSTKDWGIFPAGTTPTDIINRIKNQ